MHYTPLFVTRTSTDSLSDSFSTCKKPSQPDLVSLMLLLVIKKLTHAFPLDLCLPAEHVVSILYVRLDRSSCKSIIEILKNDQGLQTRTFLLHAWRSGWMTLIGWSTAKDQPEIGFYSHSFQLQCWHSMSFEKPTWCRFRSSLSPPCPCGLTQQRRLASVGEFTVCKTT